MGEERQKKSSRREGGLKRYPTGVRPHGAGIQIRFRVAGENRYRYETLPWGHSPADLARAGRLLAEIKAAIRAGVFRYHEYFPNSRNAGPEKASVFSAVAQAWLDDPAHDWTPAARYKFRGVLQRIFMPHLHGLPIGSIRYDHLVSAIASATEGFEAAHGQPPSASTYNNWLLCIRGVFDLAERTRAINPSDNPCQWLRNKARVKPEIDPFTMSEADEIIAEIRRAEGPLWAAWYELGFFTGLRYPSEPAALRWEDVDWRARCLHVRRSQTKWGLRESSKTGTHRVVRLNDRALSALRQAHQITGFADGFVFVQDNGRPVGQGEPQRDMLKAALRRLKIRQRPAYNMRHSYACACLQARMKPGWVAAQLGHSLEEFFRSYARWIDSDDDDREVALMNDSFAKVGKRWAEKPEKLLT